MPIKLFLRWIAISCCLLPAWGAQAGDLEKHRKMAYGKAMAWSQLEYDVKMDRVDEFKEHFQRFMLAGILQDRDSGYYEVLHACASKKPRQLGRQFLQHLLRNLCTKNIIQWMPDVAEALDLDGLLLVRKYCPVGGAQVDNLLEMLPGLHERNPLARYLLENWDVPEAIEHKVSGLALHFLFSDTPRGQARLGEDLIESIDGTLKLAHRNILAFSERMSKEEFAVALPTVLQALEGGRVTGEVLRRIDRSLELFRGELAVSVLVGSTLHIFRRGAGSFVVIARSEEENIEEIRYPPVAEYQAGTAGRLTYRAVPTDDSAVLIYNTAAVVRRAPLHHILGMTLHASEELEELEENLENFIKHHRAAAARERDADAVHMQVFIVKLAAPVNAGPVALHRQRQRQSRYFRIWSSADLLSSRETRDSDISLQYGPPKKPLQDLLGIDFSESEASYDQGDLISSSEEGGDDTLFQRRRWWGTTENAQSPSIDELLGGHGYDSSMSRDFYYPRDTFESGWENFK